MKLTIELDLDHVSMKMSDGSENLELIADILHGQSNAIAGYGLDDLEYTAKPILDDCGDTIGTVTLDMEGK